MYIGFPVKTGLVNDPLFIANISTIARRASIHFWHLSTNGTLRKSVSPCNGPVIIQNPNRKCQTVSSVENAPEYETVIYLNEMSIPRRSGETIQKSAIPPRANQRTFHTTTNPIAREIVARNKHVYFGRTMELGVSFHFLPLHALAM